MIVLYNDIYGPVGSASVCPSVLFGRGGSVRPSTFETLPWFPPTVGMAPLPPVPPGRDVRLAQFLERGICYGFRIGFRDKATSLIPASSNMSSVDQVPEIVDDYIAEEVRWGRLVPTPSALQVSPIGIIPMKSSPGKFRMIVDLFSPKGHSINDAINPPLCSLHYATVANAARRVMACGQ
uniref:Uncharacterized protein n=1 Tax=Amphimedon queenslandica TaxID=400682 RepID=A0A1X7UTD7_AMPQE